MTRLTETAGTFGFCGLKFVHDEIRRLVTISWLTVIRYLDVFITQSRKFKCVLDHAKRSFYKAAYNIMGKVGRIASEEITLQLIKSKCIPVLLYGLEACPLNKTQTQSLDFVTNPLFLKLFNTSDIALVKQCQEQFDFTLPSVALERRRTKLMHKLCCVDFFT